MFYLRHLRIFNIYNSLTGQLLLSIDEEKYSNALISDFLRHAVEFYTIDSNIDISIKVGFKP